MSIGKPVTSWCQVLLSFYLESSDVEQVLMQEATILIEDCAKRGEEVQELMKIFFAFISDEISNFNTDLYYQNPDYLEWSYREGKLLD